MEIKTTLLRLQAIAFSLPNRMSLLEELYAKRPERGGSKIAWRIGRLRRFAIEHLGPESEYARTQATLLDQYYEPATDFEARKAELQKKVDDGKASPNAPMELERQPKSDSDKTSYRAEMTKLLIAELSFDGELFTRDEIDAAGYALSGAELDALTGLLIQPEIEPVAPTA